MATSSRRPGGRTARIRASVMQAVGDVLAELGLAGVELADIARRAGVGKTTVYRRWGSAAALVADLLADMAEQSTPRSHTGSLHGDLEANARLVQQTLDDRRQGRVFAALIAAATGDSPTARGTGALLRRAHRGVGAVRRRGGRAGRTAGGHR